MLKHLAPLAVLLVLLMVAAAASADVLIDTSHLSGRCIRLGIWNKPYEGGNHPEVEATVYRGGWVPRGHPAKLIVRRTLTATKTWRTHTLACPAPGHYTVRLIGWGWHASYMAHVP
jgi:hypothetical protein